MKPATSPPYVVRSISEWHRLFLLPKPDHPSVSVIDFDLLSFKHSDVWKHFTNDFYCVVLKKGASAKFKYGQRDYDFDEGMMSFTKPGQVFSVTDVSDDLVTGYMLVFKAEFIRPYSLGKAIKNYGFFSYSVAESLHLSDKEVAVISELFQKMQQELRNNIDLFSQDVLVSYVELLLNYANRFYSRQFVTRKSANNDLLIRLDEVLSRCFDEEKRIVAGRFQVQAVASELNVSVNYLSDMLRSVTGYNTQQYIHDFLIEKAKELLSTTRLNVSEIAYQLGFEHPQSFNKLFRRKANMSPLAYRQSFN